MLESLLGTYGYPILIIGTFLEGETVLVLGGLAARLTYLSLTWVIACALCGTLLADQLCFLLGRHRGKNLLSRYPSWQPRVERALDLVEHHQTLIILGFRFLYGLRSVTPFAIGVSKVSHLRFTLLSLIGTSVWATGIGFAAYHFGQAVEAMLNDIKRYEIELIGVIVGLALLITAWHLCRRRRSKSLESE
jgi:membrane protein DedA with SNARE-associated domain